MKRNSPLVLWMFLVAVVAALIAVSIPTKRAALNDIRKARQMGGFRHGQGQGPAPDLSGSAGTQGEAGS